MKLYSTRLIDYCVPRTEELVEPPVACVDTDHTHGISRSGFNHVGAETDAGGGGSRSVESYVNLVLFNLSET